MNRWKDIPIEFLRCINLYRQIKLFVREEKPTYVFIHRRNSVLEIVDFTTILSTKHIAAQIRWFFLQQLSNSFQSVEWALNNCGSHSHFMPYIFFGGEGEKQKASALTLMVRNSHQNHQQKYHGWLLTQKMFFSIHVTSPQNFHVQVKATGISGQIFCELKWTKINRKMILLIHQPQVRRSKIAQRVSAERGLLGRILVHAVGMEARCNQATYSKYIKIPFWIRQTSTCMKKNPRESLFHEMRAKRSQEALLAMECLQAKWSLNRSMR